MLKKTSLILVIAALLLGSLPDMALADPDTASPSAPSASPGASVSASTDTATDASATLSPDASASAQPGILIKVGDEGDNVILLQLRLRDLGYYNYKITSFFGDFTKDAVADFQRTNKIDSDGVAGIQTLEALYSNDAKRKPIEPLIKPKPVAPSGGKVKYGKLRDWFTYVNNRWPKGMACKVVDFNSRKSYTMVRVGGQLHADVAPKTKKDTQVFLSTYGGDWSWERRAVIVYLRGEAIAASINGEPHGSTGVSGNGMNTSGGHLQQVCIHFLNSRTHVHNMRDPAHQRQVKRAAGQ